MSDFVTRDVEYACDGTRMIGYLCAPEGAAAAPGILLIHDAFGLGADMIEAAHRYAMLGYAVFAIDLWGNRTTPTTEPEIGPLIGAMVGDRRTWMARLTAAQEALEALPEIDGNALVAIGYCFGGTSALEYLRSGGTVRGAVSIHGGLDLLEFDWDARVDAAQVLVFAGADDPMSTTGMLMQLEAAMSAAGVDWEVDRYGNTKHGFTNPKSQFSPNPEAIGYNPRSAARVWGATARFLQELFPTSDQAEFTTDTEAPVSS